MQRLWGLDSPSDRFYSLGCHSPAWILVWIWVFFLQEKGFFPPGDWEEAHGDVGGGRKQQLAEQTLFSHLSFSSGRRGGREKALEK